MSEINAPFSRDQVEILNSWQQTPTVHPYTCANSSDSNHKGDGRLVAGIDGWRCPECEYRQFWAHDHPVPDQAHILGNPRSPRLVECPLPIEKCDEAT